MASTLRHRPSPSDILDMDSLVWPPPNNTGNPSQRRVAPSFQNPQLLQAAQQVKTPARHSSAPSTPHRHHREHLKPTVHRTSTTPRVPSHPHDVSAQTHETLSHPPTLQRRAVTTNSFVPQSQQQISHMNTPLHGSRRSSGKDYPSGYSPTPVPMYPNVTPTKFQIEQYPSSSSSASEEESTPPRTDALPFFEPLDPAVAYSPEDQYTSKHHLSLSPVFENGRQMGVCIVPPHLPQGGVIERGWPQEYFPPSQSPQSHAAISAPSPKPSAPPPKVPSPPIPTRLGYWNRRGDTLTASGRVRLAPPSQQYPPDLATYPQYSMMNERGDVMLPPGGEARVLSWRECKD